MGLNPLKHGQTLVSNLMAGTGEDGTPDRWDDTGAVAKLGASIRHYSYLWVAGAMFVFALVLFLVPVLPSAHRNIGFLGVGFWLLTIAGAYAHGRTNALQTLENFDLHILYTGNGIRARLGKTTGEVDDKSMGFKVAKQFSRGGLEVKYEQFRDRFARNEIGDHKEKYHRVGSDGTGDVVDGLLKQTTFTADRLENDISLFNTVAVTHAGDLDDDLDSKNRESMTTLPPVVDKRTGHLVQLAFNNQVRGADQAEAYAQQLQDYVDELEEYVDPGGQPIFEATTGLLGDLGLTRSSEQDREAEKLELDTSSMTNSRGESR
jgi:hypothetical protein